MLQVNGGSRESSGLGDLFDSHVHHLTTAHYVFLRHWDQLIDLEAKETQVNHFLRNTGSKPHKFSSSKMMCPFPLSTVAACKKQNMASTLFEE